MENKGDILKMLKHFLFTLAIFSLFNCQFVKAGTVAQICSTCNTSSSFKYQAESISDLRTTVIKVVNPVTSQLKTFNIEFVPPEPGAWDNSGFQATEIPNLPSDQVAVNTASDFYRDIHDFFDANRDVPEEILPSAYDLIGRTYNVNNLKTYYNYSQPPGAYWATYSSVLASIAGKVVNSNIIVELKFSDDSKALFKINGLDSNGHFTFELDSIMDKSGDQIGIDYRTMQDLKHNTYNFDGQSIEKYLRAAAQYGIRIVNVNSMPSGSGGSFTCKTVKGRLQCTKVK